MNSQFQQLQATQLGLEHLLSPRVGIGRALVQHPLQAREPRVYLFVAEPAFQGPQGVLPSRSNSGGAGLSRDEARLSALGELVEGYCATYVEPSRLVFGTYRELSRKHELLEPTRFALFSERQYQSPGFPFSRFTEDTPLAWVWGHSLVRKRSLLVPASRVYMPYRGRRGEANIGPVISTGLAAGPSLDRAILSGLYECLERDAFTLFWMNELPVRRIVLGGASGESAAGRLFRRHFEVPGYEYRAYDITQELGVPTVYVLLRCQTFRGPIHVVGAAARLDGGQATVKALLEAVQGTSYVLYLLDSLSGWRPAADFSNVTDFRLSCLLYNAAPELVPRLFDVEQRITSEVSLEELPRAGQEGVTAGLDELVRRLEARGYEAVVVDLTTPDVEAVGVKVVRVVTPELQPLHADHRWPFLGGRRLYESPARCGSQLEEPRFNPYPHPFP